VDFLNEEYEANQVEIDAIAAEEGYRLSGVRLAYAVFTTKKTPGDRGIRARASVPPRDDTPKKSSALLGCLQPGRSRNLASLKQSGQHGEAFKCTGADHTSWSGRSGQRPEQDDRRGIQDLPQGARGEMGAMN
jgi:hypothetical protein